MISLLMEFVIIIIGIFFVLCIVNLKRKKGGFNKPHWLLLLSLFLQFLLFVMFFSNQFEKIPAAVSEIFWWGTVLCGIIFGVMNFKKNMNLSILSVMISFAMGGLMVLMIVITAM